jgi:hypothetical protein
VKSIKHHGINDHVQVAMLDFQFDDTQLYVFLIGHVFFGMRRLMVETESNHQSC